MSPEPPPPRPETAEEPPGEAAEPAPLATVEPAPPQRERYPFWNYGDVLLFGGLAVPALFAGWALAKGIFLIFHLHTSTEVAELLPAQVFGYLFLFFILASIFRISYDRPFWRSLAWHGTYLPFGWMVICGMVTALLVAGLASTLIKAPTTSNPMTELMQGRSAILMLAVFGVTLAPLSEELVFRGFLQPLLVRSLGTVPGILAAAIPFGLLHYREYGNSWRHAVLIALAGAAFGWMRHATGSTRASTVMHASYNGLIFLAVIYQGKPLPHG
jgi:membrane protease YdiL (CAAX protease family)